MKIKVGDKIPLAEFFVLDENKAVKKIKSNSLLNSKKVIIIGVPGAFTKVCSAKHLPGYVNNFQLAQKKGTFFEKSRKHSRDRPGPFLMSLGCECGLGGSELKFGIASYHHLHHRFLKKNVQIQNVQI